ncbi:hypothetical protein ACFFQF_22540 [Haladaptatus pallidirubidus]
MEGFLIILIIIFLPNGLYGVIRKRFLEKSDEATSLSSDQPTAGHSEEQ